MDIQKFLNAALKPRETVVDVPELQAWFGKDVPAQWTVRGLTVAELARANQAAESGLEPLRSLVDQKGGILRRRLFEEEKRLSAEAKSAGDRESAAKKLRAELNNELTNLGKSE